METAILELLQNYGWYIFGGVIILAYIWTKIQPSVHQFLQKRSEEQYAAKYHKDPDVFTQRLLAQQLRTQKLQEEYEKDMALFKEKQEQKEAMKREEILRRTENQAGQVLGNGEPSSSKVSTYNPLTGDNTRSYRPVKRSPCSGGGCGR